MPNNLFLVANLYTLFSNQDQISGIEKVMTNGKENILIYDWFESRYIPSEEVKNLISNNIHIRRFIKTNNLRDILILFSLVIKILFSKNPYCLYLDSCTTVIEHIFFLLFRLKKFKIIGLCFTFPYIYKNHENNK